MSVCQDIANFSLDKKGKEDKKYKSLTQLLEETSSPSIENVLTDVLANAANTVVTAVTERIKNKVNESVDQFEQKHANAINNITLFYSLLNQNTYMAFLAQRTAKNAIVEHHIILTYLNNVLNSLNSLITFMAKYDNIQKGSNLNSFFANIKKTQKLVAKNKASLTLSVSNSKQRFNKNELEIAKSHVKTAIESLMGRELVSANKAARVFNNRNTVRNANDELIRAQENPDYSYYVAEFTAWKLTSESTSKEYDGASVLIITEGVNRVQHSYNNREVLAVDVYNVLNNERKFREQNFKSVQYAVTAADNTPDGEDSGVATAATLFNTGTTIVEKLTVILIHKALAKKREITKQAISNYTGLSLADVTEVYNKNDLQLSAEIAGETLIAYYRELYTKILQFTNVIMTGNVLGGDAKSLTNTVDNFSKSIDTSLSTDYYSLDSFLSSSGIARYLTASLKANSSFNVFAKDGIPGVGILLDYTYSSSSLANAVTPTLLDGLAASIEKAEKLITEILSNESTIAKHDDSILKSLLYEESQLLLMALGYSPLTNILSSINRQDDDLKNYIAKFPTVKTSIKTVYTDNDISSQLINLCKSLINAATVGSVSIQNAITEARLFRTSVMAEIRKHNSIVSSYSNLYTSNVPAVDQVETILSSYIDNNLKDSPYKYLFDTGNIALLADIVNCVTLDTPGETAPLENTPDQIIQGYNKPQVEIDGINLLKKRILQNQPKANTEQETDIITYNNYNPVKQTDDILKKALNND